MYFKCTRIWCVRPVCGPYLEKREFGNSLFIIKRCFSVYLKPILHIVFCLSITKLPRTPLPECQRRKSFFTSTNRCRDCRLCTSRLPPNECVINLLDCTILKLCLEVKKSFVFLQQELPLMSHDQVGAQYQDEVV